LGYNHREKVSVHYHDHCQNNNGCTSGKAKRGFANTSIDDRGNPAGKGVPELSGFSEHRG
jgi:hypothetical protein